MEQSNRNQWPSKQVIGRSGNTKRAELLADRIESDILSMGWPVGEIIGSEAELIERYDVSRAVLREAVRLLEHHFIAEMRRGRNGGLRVTSPDPAAVADAVALFLRHRKMSPADLFDVRVAIEMTAVRLAAERASEDDINRLRALAGESSAGSADSVYFHGSEFHELIAEISGNAGIHLFVQVINMLSGALVDPSPIGPVAEDARLAHVAIAEAIAAGDVALAQRRLQRHFAAAAAAGFPVTLGEKPTQPV